MGALRESYSLFPVERASELLFLTAPDFAPHPLLRRERLIDLTEYPFQAPVTFFTAGAGYGKTAFAVEWAEHTSMRVGWLTLNRGDNDLTSLVSRLRMALQYAQAPQALAGDGFREGARQPEGDPALFLVELAAADRDLCLIIDNCHLLTDTSCLGLLNDVIRQLPPRVFMLLLGRKRLPLQLGRLRSQGSVREIGQDDLRFTESETKPALRLLTDREIDDDVARSIWSAGEGWIAGINLSGMSFQPVADGTHSSSESLLKRNAFLDEYVEQEIIEPLPVELQAFVLATAELPYLSVELCDAVLERTDSSDMLAFLRREFSFLVPIDDEPNRIRYHHLIHESARRLAATGTTEQFRSALQRNASRWLLSAGDLEAAAELALGADDVRWVAEMTRPLCRYLAERSRFESLGLWVDRFPPDLFALDPEFDFWRIIASLGLGRTVGVGELLDDAEARWASTGNALFAGRASLCRGMLAFFSGHDERVDQLLTEAMALLPHTAIVERLYVTTFRGKLTFRQGRDETAVGELAVAESYAARLPIDEQWSWRVLGPDRGTAYALRGDLGSATTKYRLLLSEMPPAQHELEAMFRCRLINHAIERNDLEAATDELAIVERLLADQRSVGRHEAVLAKARLLFAVGQRDEAEQWGIDHVKELRRLPGKNQLVLLLARIWLERGEFSLVRSWLADINSLEYPWVQAFGDINFRTLAIDLDLAEERFDRAARVAEQMTAEAASTKRWSEFIGLSVRWAVALHQLGHQAQSRQVLRPAMERGVKGGFVRAFHVPGFDVTALFADLWGESRENLQVKRALREVVESSFGFHAAMLTKRELEVLRLVAQGSSNQHIANDMYISINTVRNHLVNICRRLDASSRMVAVSRARELGLLD